MARPDTADIHTADRHLGRRARLGVVLAALGVTAQLVWCAWRVLHLPLHLVGLVTFVVELAGLAATVAITMGLARARVAPALVVVDPRDSHRFAFSVADLVGEPRPSDVHRDVARVVRAMPHRRPRRSAEAAMVAVYLEGPRRLAWVLLLSIGLLLGAAPMPMPPVWAVAVAGGSLVLVAASHVALGHGRVRVGDRLRWSYSSIGEVVGAVDLDGVAPRRWVGTMASLVVVNLAVALRGMSDRWTHGLPPMADRDRVVAMTLALLVVAGALFTMRTVQAPVLDEARWSRRLEERTARQSALGATVAIGLIGLLAGVLPGSVDPADDDPVRVEHLVDEKAGTVGG